MVAKYPRFYIPILSINYPQNHLLRTLPLRETPPGFHHILRIEHECPLTTTYRENSRGGMDVYLVYTSAFLYFTSCSSPMLQS